MSVLARLYYRRPLQLDAMLESQSGKLADIYTTDQPHDDSVTNDSIPEYARTASLDRGLVVNMSCSGQCVLNPSIDLTSEATGNSTSDVTPRHDATSEHDDRAARGSPISVSSDRDVSFRRDKINGVRSTVGQILGQNHSAAAAAAADDGQSHHSPAKCPGDDSSQGVASTGTGSINVRL